MPFKIEGQEITPEEILSLMASSKNVVEWNTNMDLVKAANNGGYPIWWFREVILSGFAARMVESWQGRDDQK